MSCTRIAFVLILLLVPSISLAADETSPVSHTVRVGLASLRRQPDLASGVAKVKATLAECQKQKIDIVCFPETYLPGLRGGDRNLPPVDQPAMEKAVAEIATACGKFRVAAILGIEWQSQRGLENRAIVIDEAGKVVGYQTKNQITPGGESENYVPDGKRRMFDVAGVRFGIAICHEGWRYPETVRWAAFRGAQVVFQPQVTGADYLKPGPPVKWGESFYEKAMQCRAEENSIYFVSVNRALVRQNSSSSVIDPKGDLVTFIPRGEEKLLAVDLDLQQATRLYAQRFQPRQYNESPTDGLKDRQAPMGRSHATLRPLPPLTQRPLSDGPSYFVDPATGNDAGPGSRTQPWATVNHALRQLKAGDTLLLRKGTYFENVYCAVAGTQRKPITIRSYPGERVIIDGGMPEFQRDPTTAWMEFPEGAEGEYVSLKPYRNIRDVVGHFGDSHVGLQTYWHDADLRAKNELWILDKKTKAIDPVYCGPGLWYNKQTGHIHVRLAPTHVSHPEIPNYAGETDPRKLPLVIAPFDSVPLRIDQAMHVRFQDLVIRGGGLNTVVMNFGVDVEFDNVTIFAGTYGLRASSTGPFRMVNSAIHGGIPPWGSRNENSLHTFTPRYYDPFVKASANEIAAGVSAAPATRVGLGPPTAGRNIARLPTHALLVTEGTYEFEVFAYPRNHDWDISHCDFTDAHDGVYLSGHTIRFHNNRVDNIQDDGIYLSSPVPYFSDDIFIYQNVITRCLMAFGCHSRGGPRGNIFIYRNIADLRQGVYAGRGTPDAPAGRVTTYQIFLMHGRGRPLGVESMYFYHNTFISRTDPFGYAHRTLTRANDVSQRRVFNNLCVYLNRYGRLRAFDKPTPDIHSDGNLHWCSDPNVKVPDNYLERIRNHPASLANKEGYPPGWAGKDLVADPQFVKFTAASDAKCDWRLREGSPAIKAGITLPSELEDPLRPNENTPPDIGAIPFGQTMFPAGRRLSGES